MQVEWSCGLCPHVDTVLLAALRHHQACTSAIGGIVIRCKLAHSAYSNGCFIPFLVARLSVLLVLHHAWCMLHSAAPWRVAHCLFAHVWFRQVSSSHRSGGPCGSFHTCLWQHAYHLLQAQLTSGSWLLHPTKRGFCVLAWFGTSLAHAQAALVIACCRVSLLSLFPATRPAGFFVAFCSSKRPRHSTPHAVQQ